MRKKARNQKSEITNPVSDDAEHDASPRRGRSQAYNKVGLKFLPHAPRKKDCPRRTAGDATVYCRGALPRVGRQPLFRDPVPRRRIADNQSTYETCVSDRTAANDS